MPEGREREIVLSPNEYCYIRDTTAGAIKTAVGPLTITLTQQEQTVIFDPKTKEFGEMDPKNAPQLFTTAPEGWYVILLNPINDGDEHPPIRSQSNIPSLSVGRKVVIPGPVSFPLWPGQMASVVRGHKLRTNQYLICEVYDAEAAKENWEKAVIEQKKEGEDNTKEKKVSTSLKMPQDLANGKRIVIKGTEIAFYIPPTGIKVIPDRENKYVREAVTLEAMEYSVLLSEQGEKEFPKGPAVVFPRPDQEFVLRDKTRRFRAIELNDISGIYVKVTAPYEDESGKHEEGEELFITGKEQRFYFPRAEHSLISYNEGQEVHYGVAIPEGEGRYVMDRISGEIRIEKGPQVYLADPRTEVIVRRVLTDKQVQLWFPGNAEAQRINEQYRMASDSKGIVSENALFSAYGDEEAPMTTYNLVGSVSDSDKIYGSSRMRGTSTRGVRAKNVDKNVAKGFAGDNVKRNEAFTPPRTLTLNTKYDGSVIVDVWPGYAIQKVSKTGDRKVIVGPKTILLEYHEGLEKMALSTGKPKNTDSLLETVYLQVSNNKVADVISAETSDMVPVEFKVSYRVRFTGDEQKWFNVANYVKLMCDHIRSHLKAELKSYSVVDFYNGGTSIIRDTVLGPKPSKKKDEDGPKDRVRAFEENNMEIYDVEVLNISIKDKSISEMLQQTSEKELRYQLENRVSEARLEHTKQEQDITRQIEDAVIATAQHKSDLEMDTIKKTVEVLEERLKKSEKELEDKRNQVTFEIEKRTMVDDSEISKQSKLLELKLTDIQAQTKAHVDRMKSIPEGLIEAMHNMGEDIKMAALAENFGDLAVLDGLSIKAAAEKYIDNQRYHHQITNGKGKTE